MAGLGRRVFVPGEVLTATNVQGFLMDQTIMVFADDATRDSTISAPTDGMFCYSQATNSLSFFNGSASAFQPFTAGGGAGLQDVFFLMGA